MQRQMSSKRSLLAVIALSSIVTVCCAQEKPNAPLPDVASSIAAPSATMLSPEASGTAEAADPEQNAAWQNPTSPSATPSAPASAPQGAPPSTNSSQTPAQPAQSAQSGKTQTADQATSKDRLFYTLPNFLTL